MQNQAKTIEYTMLDCDNFFVTSLNGFKRRQKVENCWRKSGNNYALTPVAYTEDWSLSERREMAQRIISLISAGYIAIGAKCGNEIVGFALIDNNRFGSEKQYINLAELYVSEPYRRKGIGKALFKLACEAAKKLGGTKLYISAHSAEESIAAYKNYGCTLAKEINQALADKEPCDLQLEFDLK